MKAFGLLATILADAALLVKAAPCNVTLSGNQVCEIPDVSSVKCCQEYTEYFNAHERATAWPFSCTAKDWGDISDAIGAGACHFDCGTKEACTISYPVSETEAMQCTFPHMCSKCCIDLNNSNGRDLGRCDLEDLESVDQVRSGSGNCTSINSDCGGSKGMCTFGDTGNDGKEFSCTASDICSNCCYDLDKAANDTVPRCTQGELTTLFESCEPMKALFAARAKRAQFAAGGTKTIEVLLAACTGGLVGGALVGIAIVLRRRRRDVFTYEAMLG